jgi:hypothetical protein
VVGTKPDIGEVWNRIKAHAGATFTTRTGKEFTYAVDGDQLTPSRAKQNIAKSNFATALELAPLRGPGDITNVVRGSSYVWAVLHDPRIRKGDW